MPLLDVGCLLAHPLQDTLHLDDSSADRVLGSLGADGVDLSVELLEEKIWLSLGNPI